MIMRAAYQSVWRYFKAMIDVSADAYMNEPVRYPALQVINLKEEGAKVADPYRNMVINRVNGSCLRLAVFECEYRWHYHPKSDELFIVVEVHRRGRVPSYRLGGRAGAATTPVGERDYSGNDSPPHSRHWADRKLMRRRVRCGDRFC
jgi:hypothetical protein